MAKQQKRGILKMRNLEYVFGAVLVAISVFYIFFCCFRGRGASHKKLVCFASLLGTMFLICFGGNAILSLFGMGWRCTPFNVMLGIGAVLFIATLWFAMKELSILKTINHAMIVSGLVSMILVLLMIPMFLLIYFTLFSWHDKLATYEDQTIVCANDMHGGSCSWRYYTHVNNLVHGIEITQSDWWGTPPFKS